MPSVDGIRVRASFFTVKSADKPVIIFKWSDNEY